MIASNVCKSFVTIILSISSSFLIFFFIVVFCFLSSSSSSSFTCLDRVAYKLNDRCFVLHFFGFPFSFFLHSSNFCSLPSNLPEQEEEKEEEDKRKMMFHLTFSSPDGQLFRFQLNNIRRSVRATDLKATNHHVLKVKVIIS